MPRPVSGRDLQADLIFRAASRPNPVTVMSLSETSTPPSTSWRYFNNAPGNEMTADGFARKSAIVTVTPGDQTVVLVATWQHSAAAGTGTVRTPRCSAIWGPDTGVSPPATETTSRPLFFESIPNPPPLVGSDSIEVTYNVDLGVLA